MSATHTFEGAARVDLLILRSATFNKSFVWKDAADTPIDLTGFTAEIDIREQRDKDSTLLLHFDTSPAAGDGTITLGGITGTIDLFLDETDTALLNFEKGFYDLKLQAPAGGDATRLLEGVVRVCPEVTP